jgi:hypothetical protein
MGNLNEGCGLATTTTVRVTSTEELMMPSRLSGTPIVHKPKESQTLNALANTSNAADSCRGCGKKDTCPKRSQQQCIYKQHPGYNREPKAWSESQMGKLYGTKVPNGQGAPGRESLAANFAPTTDKSDVEPLSEASKTALTAKGVVFPKPKRNFQGGKTLSTHFQILASYTTSKDASYLRPFTLCLSQDEVRGARPFKRR